MSDMLIRDIAPDLKADIAERARRHGVSLSTEAQSLLRAAVSAAPQAQPARGGLGTEIAKLFKDIGLREGEELAMPRDEPSRPALFDE